uniref:Uncharacterized protein n=2 Tax=Aegilops tauschii subsp. strangulata TaxID=200361 RepID=A0A453EAZ1_AEGTS
MYCLDNVIALAAALQTSSFGQCYLTVKISFSKLPVFSISSDHGSCRGPLPLVAFRPARIASPYAPLSSQSFASPSSSRCVAAGRGRGRLPVVLFSPCFFFF